MVDATVTTDTAPASSGVASPDHASIVATEAAHFGAMAKDWWDPRLSLIHI